MKLKIAVALVVALVLVSSFVSIAAENAGDSTAPDDTTFENLGDQQDNEDPGINPCGGGGGDVGGGTPG
ncbi:MAG: hypothetical protein HXS54_13755 [Theionarchaea archaeon]|nr:hypothetical protein [Theionarchaea archaeon]